MSDREDLFEAMLAEVRGETERAIASERRLIAPDFAAVVVAARARDPELVPEAAVDEANGYAPIIELGARVELDGEDLELGAWISAARELAEADVGARRLAGVPPLPEAPAAAQEAGRPWWATGVAVAAVLVGLAVAVPALLSAFVDGNYREAANPNQAEYVGPERAPEGGVRLEPGSGVVEQTTQEAIQHDAPEPSEGPSPVVERDPEPRARERGPSARARQRDRVAELDAEAQARWQRGDLAGAEQQFREIIDLAGRSRYADLAYGDLFTLARQRKAVDQERALWAEYLQKFPHGRFADDARAGLCRHASADQVGCWEDYLDDFPEGVHTRAARKALGLDKPAPDSP